MPFRLNRIHAVSALVLGLLLAAHDTARAQGRTTVSIQGEQFLINGSVTYPGTAAEGLLLNSRMVQAIFDDENPSTVGRSAYPDTGVWDAERNVNEFIAALPLYRSRGLRAVTINLQGGSPGWSTQDNQPGITTAFNSDGSLKSAWLSRLDRALRAADDNGIVVMLGLFYFGQDHRLASESAVIRAVDGVTDWLVGRGYSNVLVEINNEADLWYNHAILQPARVTELINRVKQRSGGLLKVSTSLGGGAIPSATLISASDYVLLHGNNQSASQIAGMVDSVRGSSAFRAQPKPIVFNEDSVNLSNMDAAVNRKASWGYYDQGRNDYKEGFQSPPVYWGIHPDDGHKMMFFDRVAQVSGGGGSSPSPPTSVNVTSFSLINADTDQAISGYDALQGGSVTLNLATLPTRNLNLRANTSPATVGSVRFGLNGNPSHLIESTAPYALFGDSNGNYGPWTLGSGTHSVSATPYTLANAGGSAGPTLSLSITIVDNPSAPADTTPPSVSVSFSSSTGAGQVLATDASPITRVEVRLDGSKIAEGTSVPLPFTVNLGSLSAGQHTLEALVTDAPGNVGRATSTFSVTSPSAPTELAVVSYSLINVDTNQPIPGFETLTGGDVTVNLAQLPTTRLTLRANSMPGIVGSVVFGLNANPSHLVENVAPYSFSGDENGSYRPWSLGVGTHTVTATPYSAADGSGTRGTTLSIRLLIIDDVNAPRPPSNVRIIR